jgi:NAD(P)-dependent dehydrogenase (short-subunit alcohol dehydrogenase family)
MPERFRELFDLRGKVAIVTGASKGIGEAMARGLAEFGAQVVVSSRKQEAVEAVAASIRAAGQEATAVAAHVGDATALCHLVDAASERYGGVDILVNNAATNPVYGPLLDTDDAVFDKILSVNLQAPLELARLAHPHLVRRGGGSIINVSSIGGLSPEPGLGLYSVSKAALLSLTKVMAREWAGDGIRVNGVCPGLIQTKFSAAMWQDEATLQRFLCDVPLGRIGQPQDLVGLAIYLASDASRYCTGAIFTVDGGYTI